MKNAMEFDTRPIPEPATAGAVRTYQEIEPRPQRSYLPLGVTRITSAANATMFTVPEGQYYKVIHMTYSSVTGSATTISVYHVPSGGSSSALNAYTNFPIAAGAEGTFDIVVGAVYGPGEQMEIATDFNVNIGLAVERVFAAFE